MEQTDFLPYEKPTPPGTHVKPIPRDLFIQHDVCVETRWESMYSRGYVTPASLFYIRNHGPTPIDRRQDLAPQGPGPRRRQAPGAHATTTSCECPR